MNTTAPDTDQIGIAPHRSAWARLKYPALLAVIVLVLVEFLGLPHLRVTYDYRGPADDPTIIAARYWSVTGTREVHYFEMGDRMPLVAMLPLERSLFSYGRDAVSASWSSITGD